MSAHAPLPHDRPPGPEAPNQVIGAAVQKVTAARLGRGFVPLALLAGAGLFQLLPGGVAAREAWLLAVGAPAAGVAMLAYGLRGVQRAFGRREAAWWSLAGVGSILPPAFGVWVVGWRGMASLAGAGPDGVWAGALFTALGAWSLRSWLRVVETQRLAEVMALTAPEVGT